MDLWGPAVVETLGRKKYTVNFTDNMTQWTDIDFLTMKDKTLDAYCDYKKWLEVQDRVVIKIL